MQEQNTPLILIVDDEKAILKTLKDALTDEGFRVETLSQGKKALDLIGKLIPDLLLLDIFMPNCNGLELLSQIKKEFPDQKVMMISGFGNIPIAIEAIQKGAIDFFEKPLNLDEILHKIAFLKESDRKIKEVTPYQADKNLLRKCGVIGESNLFLELIEQTERLAPHSIPILISGEVGTGKTLLARYIHEKSSLKNLVTIDCQTLEESTSKNIFAKHMLEQTPETFYLKHVDLLSNANQKNLLLVLEKKENKTCRIIASTRKSLFHAMREEQFNTSLFYHLNRAPLEVPPLRKRAYDIPLLLNHYLAHYNRIHNKTITLTTQSIRQLKNHSWPGNIVELKSFLQNLVVTSDNFSVITPNQLDQHKQIHERSL